MNEKIKKALENLTYESGVICKNSLDTIEDYCNQAEENEKELIAEQHRLFDLCKEQEKTIAQLTEADYYFITSMALDMLKSDSNFALMYVDNIFCLVDTKGNSFEVIDNYDIDTENISKTKCQELNDLREFVKALCKMKIVDSNPKIYGINENDIALIKKVCEKYGK